MRIRATLFAMAMLAAPLHAADRARNDTLSLEAMHNFSKCIVERTRPGAEKLLAMDFRTPEYRAGMKRFAKGHGYCAWNSRIAFSQVLFAGGLAEALLVQDKALGRIGAKVAITPPTAMPVARSGLETSAFCVVRKEPAKVEALLATPVAGEEEDRTLRGLGDTLIECIPSGVTVRMNRPGLRAMLALAAYRLLTETSPAGNG